jgi:hypothetical protein
MADVYRPRNLQFNIAIGASSTACTAGQVVPPGCTKVRLCATQPAYVAFQNGSAPTAAVGNMLIPANWPEYFVVSPGDYIACIQQSAAGVLNVTYLSS